MIDAFGEQVFGRIEYKFVPIRERAQRRCAPLDGFNRDWKETYRTYCSPCHRVASVELVPVSREGSGTTLDNT